MRMLVGFLLPFVVVVISYLVIFYHVRHTSTYLRRDQNSGSNRFDDRELKMTWSILLIFFCYIICTFPLTIVGSMHEESSYFWIPAHGLFLMLFIVNFLVYSYQNEQYQKAYIDYLMMVKEVLCNGSINGYRSRNHDESIGKSSSRKLTNESML